MGLCGGSGDADGPHELIDVLVPIAIIAGVCIGMQDRVAGGKVQRRRVEDVGTDVLLATIGALGPHYNLTLYTAVFYNGSRKPSEIICKNQGHMLQS